MRETLGIGGFINTNPNPPHSTALLRIDQPALTADVDAFQDWKQRAGPLLSPEGLDLPDPGGQH